MRRLIMNCCLLGGGAAVAGLIHAEIVPPTTSVGLEQLGTSGVEFALSMDHGTALDELENRARAGDLDALHICARIALLGLEGKPVDRARGLAWLSEAARRGHPEAQHFLAVDRLRDGWSEEALAEVLPFLDDAAPALPAAREFLLFLYRTAPWMDLPPGALRTAFLESCARAGSGEAAYELGLLAESSGEKDNAESFYRRAAQRASLRALIRMRETGPTGGPVAEGTPSERGMHDPLPPFERAQAISRGYVAGTSEEILAYLEEAASQGHPVAQYQLGRLLSGRPDRRTGDTVPALSWFLAAAEGENPDAMHAIAEAFSFGSLGVEPDSERAHRWHLEAARRGHAGAAARLGEAYLAEDGFPFRDPVAAKAWFERAALEGNVSAQYQLAVLLDRGPAFLRDPLAARRLYEAAGMRGMPAARERLAILLMEEGESESALTHALALFYTLPGDPPTSAIELERRLPATAVERARGLSRYLSFGLPKN